MNTTEIAREIAELMGDQWEYDPAVEAAEPGTLPDLSNCAHLGVIEWWCRERWVYLIPYLTVARGVLWLVATLEDDELVGTDQEAQEYPKALLAAVRIAAEVER